MKNSMKMFFRLVSLFIAMTIFSINSCINVFAEEYLVVEPQECVSKILLDYMENSPGQVYRVIIWLEDIDTTKAVEEAISKIDDYEPNMARLRATPIKDEKDDAMWECFISTKRNAMKNCYSMYTSDFSEETLSPAEVIYNSQYMPVVIAELSSERIQMISSYDIVESIDYYCDDVFFESNQYSLDSNYNSNEIECYNIYDNMLYINAINEQGENIFDISWGTLGYGINIGVLDGGVVNVDYAGLYNANISIHYPSEAPIDDHATKVTEIIYRLAPDADYFCTSYNIFLNPSIEANLLTELEWFIANNVDVINISMCIQHGIVADQENIYGQIAQIFDRYVQKYDITIVMAAGNSGANSVASGAMAYNVITVGNYCRQYGTILGLYSSYNNEENTEYAYKPDICAPGYVSFIDNTNQRGTSFATPMVTGVVALMMACRSSLRVNPTQIKSILTASVSLSTCHDMPLDDSNYRSHGAGVINASRANQILMLSEFITANTEQYSRYYCDYEIELSADLTTRVSLTFEKVMPTDSIVCELADLNIHIYDVYSGQVYSSTTTNNNVELIEFVPPEEGTYTIRVEQLIPAMSPDRPYITPYSIAWIQG